MGSPALIHPLRPGFLIRVIAIVPPSLVIPPPMCAIALVIRVVVTIGIVSIDAVRDRHRHRHRAHMGCEAVGLSRLIVRLTCSWVTQAVNTV